MNCLHFKVDRVSRICPDCGTQLSAVTGRMIAPPPIQNLPIAPPPQEIAVRPSEPAAPVTELPEGDDIYEILRTVQGKKAAPIVPAPPPPEMLAVIQGMKQEATKAVETYEELRAKTDAAVEAATPDWLKEAIEEITPSGTPVRTVQVQPPISEEEEPIAEPGSIVASNRGWELLDRPYDGIQPEGTNDEKPTGDLAYPDEPVFQFLTGDAGTGKSYSLRQRAEQYDDAKLVATTGIAAVNLGGTTINSLLQYGDTNGLRANYETGKLGALLRHMTQSGYYRLLIDEISMMDGHQLDILVTAVEELNVWLGENNKRLFGITVCGDFAQLPPVNAPFVFQRPTWGRFEANILKLTQPMRQVDSAFLAALQAVRRGDRPAAMSYFGPRIVQGSEEKFDGSTILSTNIEVDRYNKLRMMDLTSPAEYFKSDRVGEQLSEWTKNIPENLEMKPGALVMILANKSMEGEMIYANGDLAHYVRKLNENTAEVTLKRTGMSVLVSSVLKEKGVATGHTGKKLKREDVKGSIRYMPLRIAYATTCHKVQGLSLDNVQIIFHNKFWATPGMLFVGLSRARTPQGLRLVGSKEQFEARITVNPDIRRWL